MTDLLYLCLSLMISSSVTYIWHFRLYHDEKQKQRLKAAVLMLEEKHMK